MQHFITFFLLIVILNPYESLENLKGYELVIIDLEAYNDPEPCEITIVERHRETCITDSNEEITTYFSDNL